MTDSAQQNLRLPVDASPPPERLRWPMLLGAAAAALALHLALVTVFTPLPPEQNKNGNRTDHSMLFLSSRVMASDPEFMKKADIYDPISFLHPPESVGFSFFRTSGDDFTLDSPTEPVLTSQRLAELKPLPPFESEPVVRPLARYIVDETGEIPDADVVSVSALSYPYCVADSRPDAAFPAFPNDARIERILRRSSPTRPSVFELRQTFDLFPTSPDSGSGGFPRCEAVLTESCGIAELDLAARAWLDTVANSQNGASLRPGDRCRVVWSAKALGKEPSAR